LRFAVFEDSELEFAGFAISLRVAGAGGALYLIANTNSKQFYAIPTYLRTAPTGVRN
jgi:hypothetical protein